MVMKGLHLEDEDDDIPHHQNPSPNSHISTPQMTNSTQIFPNFPHHPSFLSPPPHLLLPRQCPPGIEIQQFPLSENTPVNSSKRPRAASVSAPSSSEDGSSIDASHRPRGRPRGSKNKPKPPVIILREPKPEPDSMPPFILEVPDGSDLITSLTRFTRRRNVGLCVLCANGAVENVTLKRSNCGLVSCQGRFDIISLSACMITSTSPFNGPIGGFTVSLAGLNGQIIIGKVGGPLVCAGTVYVVATPFNNPTYARLPLEIGCSNNNNHRVTGGGGEGGGQSSSPGSESHGEDDGSGCGTQTSVFTEHRKGNDNNSGEVLCDPTPLAARPPQPRY